MSSSRQASVRNRRFRIALLAVIMAVWVWVVALGVFGGRDADAPSGPSTPISRTREAFLPVADAYPSASERPSYASAQLDVADGTPHPFDADVRSLPNGMTAIVVQDTSAATVATRIVVKAGAAYDPPGRAGIAHLLEHLLYGGTTRLGTLNWAAEQPRLAAVAEISRDLAYVDDAADRADLEDWMVEESEAADEFGLPNEVARLLDALGATDVNATTSLEATSFLATIPSNVLQPWAVLEAERFGDPVFRTFVNERRVVEEELALRSACGFARLAHDERAVLFAGHPYAAPIGGTPVSLAQASVADVEAFFDRYYVPGNMAVVVVGDLDVDATFALLRDTLGALPGGTIADVEIVPPERSGVGQIAVPADNNINLEMSWALLQPGPTDVEAVRVAARLVASDPALRLVWHPFVTIEELSGAAILRLHGPTRDRNGAIAGARAALRNIGREGVPPSTLVAMRLGAWVDRLEELERQDRQAADLAAAWVRGEDPHTLWGRLVDLYEIDSESVVGALLRLVSTDDYTVTTGPGASGVRPKRKKKSPWARIDGSDPATSTLYDEILAIPRAPPEPRWRSEGLEWTRSADGRVIAVRNPLNTLFQATLTWPLGERDHDGICEAIGQLGLSAADDRSLGRAGVRVETPFGECGWDQVTIRLKGPASGVGAASVWVARLRTIGALGRQQPWLGFLFRDPLERRWLRARYGPAALVPHVRTFKDPTLSPAEQLDAVHWLAGIAPDVRFAGQLDAPAVAALFPGGPRTARRSPEIVRPPVPRVDLWRGRTAVGIVKVGEPYDPAHEGLYALYEHWLGGVTGVVAEELRIGAGMIYTVDTDLVRGRAPGEVNVLEVKLPSSRRSDSDVVSLAASLAEIVTRTDIDDASWSRLLDATLVHAISDPVPFRSAAARLGNGVDRGLDRETQEVAADQLARVTKTDFEAFLRQEAQIPMTIVLQGTDIDPADVRSLGEVQVLQE